MRTYLAVFVLILYSVAHASTAPIKIKAELVEESSDGMSLEYLHLDGSSFTGQYYNSKDWYLIETTCSEASVSFAHRLSVDLNMDFAVFTKGRLLRDGSEDSIRDYTMRTKNQYTRLGYQVSNLNLTKSTLGSPGFMGVGYWRVQFDLIDPNTKEKVLSIADYVCTCVDRANYRLRFRGPPNVFESLEGKFALAASNFYRE